MLINRRILWLLVLVVVGINAIGLSQPLLRNDDPVLYANIAKHIALTNDWLDLVSGGQPWLDKPHFPFWLAAVSFKLFGINSFAYLLPGFIFHLLGLVYTYRLANSLYNRQVALITALIYASSLHLLISAIDLRAEAYLLGQIMPACYYWLIYDRQPAWRPLLLASLFTAMAMMTKGLFVVITIFSGLVMTWAYTKRLSRLYSPPWLVAYLCCLLLISPELVSLYWQFDRHPEVNVFGHNHVSGLAWYFWGSQFGRFFNSGPITNTHGNPFFFVHTFLWAFLPWSLVFIVSSYRQLRSWPNQNSIDRAKNVYLLASFWITFLLFSATKFQLDHYTNILMPFAAIGCARYLEQNLNLARLSRWQVGLSILLLMVISALLLFLLSNSYLTWLIVALAMVTIYACFSRYRQFSYLEQCLIWPALAISLIYAGLTVINARAYLPYDTGYQTALLINRLPPAPVYDWNSNWLPLEFHVNKSYTRIDSPAQLPVHGNYYLVLPAELLSKQANWLNQPSWHLTAKVCGNTIDKVLRYYSQPQQLQQHLQCLMVLQHDG